jgi:nucleoside-triphosphatase THEP1
MEKNLFLQGDIAVGKSTLLRETLLPHLQNIGGFFVQRVYKEKKHVAFRLSPLIDAESYRLNIGAGQLPEKENLFLYSDEDNRWHARLTIFEQKGAEYLRKSREEAKKIILMDEIGGVELQCPLFMQTVLQILDGPQPVLGVLKAPRNFKKMGSRLAKPESIKKDVDRNLAAIRKHPLNQLLTVNRKNYDSVKLKVEKFVENALLQGK